TRWPGLLPDAYLTYRLYDLPPHSTPIIQCCVDPVFDDSASYPLAVTTDVLEYLNVGNLHLTFIWRRHQSHYEPLQQADQSE
ncbi:hypothetical protein M9458_048543, partial [Cirrhinus mrigala]